MKEAVVNKDETASAITQEGTLENIPKLEKQIIVKVEEPKKEEEQAPAPEVVVEGEASKEGEEAKTPQEEVKKETDPNQENKESKDKEKQ